jgi:hypothetical protein
VVPQRGHEGDAERETMTDKVIVKLVAYRDGRTEGLYYLADDPEIIVSFMPVFTSLGDGFVIQEMQVEAVGIMYDQCAYGL